jgi:hypothetical protein
MHTHAEGCTASTSGTASAVAQAFAEAVSSAAANAGCNYNLGSTASQASQTKVANAIAEACKLMVFSSFGIFDACCELRPLHLTRIRLLCAAGSAQIQNGGSATVNDESFAQQVVTAETEAIAEAMATC